MTAPAAPARPLDSSDLGGKRSDLRLLPVLAVCWAAGAWATACAPPLVTGAAACCALLGAGLTRWRPGSAPSSGGGRGRALGLRADRYRPVVVLALAGAGLVLASTAAQTVVRSREPLRGWIAERAVVEARGRILTDPHRVTSSAPGATGPPARRRGADVRYTLRVRLDRVSARGRTVSAAAPALLLGGPSWAALSAGRRITFTARLEATEPGDDVVAFARVPGAPRDVASGGFVWQLSDRLREGLRAACQGLPEDAGGLLPSLVVGDTSGLPDRLRSDLQTSGLTHLTAVSGANVAIVAGAVLWTATVCGVRRSARLGLALALVACFVVVARPQPSVLRAAVMGGVALTGLGLSRRPRGVPALAAAATVLLVTDPWLSRSAGFALSCLATAALLLLAPAWTRGLSRWLPVPVAAALAVPAAAQAACGPVVVLLTPAVSLAAVPANLLAEPAVAPATVAGVVAALLAQVWPAGSHLVAWGGSLATGWISRVAHAGAAAPFAALPWPPGAGGALLLGALTAVLVALSVWPVRTGGAETEQDPGGGTDLCRHRRRSHRWGVPRRPRQVIWWRRILACTILLVTAGAAGWLLGPRVPFLPSRWPPAGWAVVQCDVGQGAATVARSGPDRAILIDTGPEPSAVDGCLRRLGVRHLDLVVLTHFHADHVLGLPGALRRRSAALILVSPLAEPGEQAAAVRRTAGAARIPVEQGWAGMAGDARAGGWLARWWLLAPVEPPSPSPPGDDDDGTAINEASLVSAVEVTGPGGTLRLAGLGDLETTGQDRLLRRLDGGQVHAGQPIDVLVVAHHGSARQAGRLCERLAPRVALIGVGTGNDYGHPAPSALAMLRACGAVIHRTDTDGAVAVVPYPEGRLAVAVERRP